MIGLRFLCMAPDERRWATDGTMDWLWPLAEETGLPIALCGPALLAIVAHLAPRFPRLMFTEEMPWLSSEDQRLIFGEAFCAWHEWRPQTAGA